MEKAVFLILILSPFAASGATAASECAPAAIAAPLDGPLQPLERVRNYHVVLQSCRREGADERLAIRAMQVDGQALLLTADPKTLTTRLERAACWTCADTTSAAQKNTRLIDAVERASRQKGKELPQARPGSTTPA